MSLEVTLMNTEDIWSPDGPFWARYGTAVPYNNVLSAHVLLLYLYFVVCIVVLEAATSGTYNIS